MTEFEKMRSSQLYNFSDPEIFKSLDHAKKLCARLQTVTITDDCYREMTEDLIPGIPEDSVVCPPFHCDHGNGIMTRYGHAMQVVLVPGQHVRRGQVIAYMGSTGFSTGPHVHYEVRVNGTPVNPVGYL